MDATHVLKLPDAVANAVNNPLNNLASFSNGPELGIDATKTVNTGNIDATGITQWGVETAANWKDLYGQAGYFGYQINRRASALSDPSFNGWYALATWSLTGEAHPYDPVTASFRGLKPTNPLGQKGWGAWELAARYSDIDLNDNPLLAACGRWCGWRQAGCLERRRQLVPDQRHPLRIGLRQYPGQPSQCPHHKYQRRRLGPARPTPSDVQRRQKMNNVLAIFCPPGVGGIAASLGWPQARHRPLTSRFSMSAMTRPVSFTKITGNAFTAQWKADKVTIQHVEWWFGRASAGRDRWLAKPLS